MIRVLAALLGLAVLGALFAGFYYAGDREELRILETPVNPAPGEVRSQKLQPAIEGGTVHVQVQVLRGSLDVYVMDREWSNRLAEGGRLSLDQPFAYHAQYSALGVNDSHEFTIVSDGETWFQVVLDNSDNYYDNDTAGNQTAHARVVVRYVDQEERSLLLGYLAATPSVVLVAVTLWRQVARHRRDKERQQAMEE